MRIVLLLSALLCSAAHGASSDGLDLKELDCLRKNIYWEGRNEPLEGKIAIAVVTMNRVLSPQYPKTICGVVTQAERNSKGVPIRNMCQFSWYCDGLPDTIPVNLCTKFYYKTIKGKKRRFIHKDYNEPECAAWKQSYGIAVGIMRGYRKNYQLDGALYYHNTDVNPDWASSDNMVAKIGNHLFYNAAVVAATSAQK